jgi:hypothetical protein
MSARIDGSGEALHCTDYSQSGRREYVVSGWIKVLNQRNSKRDIVGFADNETQGSNDYHAIVGWHPPDGTPDADRYAFYIFGTSAYFTPNKLPEDGTWYYWFLRGTYQSDPYNEYTEIGWWDDSAGAWDKSGLIDLAVSEYAHVFFGNRYVEDAWSDCKLAHIRNWDTALSDAELETEKDNEAAQKTSNLVGDWKLESDALDYSGNGNDLGTKGTVSFDSQDMPLTVDNSPPNFTSGPATTNVQANRIDVNATIDERGTIYGVVVSDGANEPSVGNVKNGEDASGSPAIAADNVTVGGGIQATLNFLNLSSSTAYDLYIVAEDDESSPNTQSSNTKLDQSTQTSTDSVTIAAKDADGVDIPDQSGVKVWVYSDRGSAPELAETDEAVAGGQISIDVSGQGYTDGQVVYISAELSNGDLAIGSSTVVA